MKFPLGLHKVGDCLVPISKRGNIKAENKPTAVTYEGEMWSGHRLSYSLNNSPIPRLCGSKKYKFVCHTCDYKPCVNPSHLYLGDAKDNVRDLFERHPTIKTRLSEAQRKSYDERPERKGWLSEKRRSKIAAMSPDERKAMMDNARRFRAPGQPTKSIGAFNASVTPERKGEIARKGWVVRRANIQSATRGEL
jgi:1,2-phenylacetyl-CoA epoxidase PaaB subunit